MFYLQILLPAGLVLLLFSFGHLLVQTDYSGVYYIEQVEASIDSESLQGLTDTESSSEAVPGDGNPVLVDKYNYLKIENVFQGRLLDTKELFSFEVAVATFQTNVTADFFIKAIYEIEADLVSEISTLAVDTTSEELTTIEGRKIITDRIMVGLNDYLVKKGYNADIHYVYIINYNIV